MAVLTNVRTDANGIVEFSTGQIVTDANAQVATAIAVGFKARHAKFFPVPASSGAMTIYEWHEGMPAGSYITQAGAYVSTGGPVVTDERTVTFPAAIFVNSSTHVWEIEG
jgi:hypothetical protein